MADIIPEGSIAAILVTTSRIISTRPCLLYGTVFYSTGSNEYVDVYEGQDADSGRKLYRHGEERRIGGSIMFPVPVYCARGIYVSLSTAGDHCTVLFSPLPLSGQ